MFRKKKGSLRFCNRRDIPAMVRIERDCFDSPMEECEFTAYFRHGNTVGLVMDLRDEVIGFMFYGLFRRRIDLLNMVIAPDYQGQGFGTIMINRLKRNLAYGRKEKITTLVDDANVEAHLFFQACGFRAIYVEREVYDSGDDSYLFQFSLPDEGGQVIERLMAGEAM